MYVFIINPTAGRKRAEKIFSKIKSTTLYQEIDSRYFLTKYEGEAEEIVRHLVDKRYQKITAIIVIGGDGTLHEVMNGIGKQSIPVSVIPSGSGNDFTRGFSIRKKPLKIFEDTIKGRLYSSYWLGNYEMTNGITRHFVNSIGFGFDAEVARTANQSSYKRVLNNLGLGKLGYVIALLQVLIYFKPLTINIEIDHEKRTIYNCWMLTVANHPYYGGGMKVIPNATIQPTVFPILIIHSVSKWKVLRLFLTVFTGRHTTYREVELFEATTLKVSSPDRMYCQIDGEIDICNPCKITKQSEAVKIVGINSQKRRKVAG